jgi:hypothetical protein
MFVVLQKKRIDILKPKLLVTHPHPEEFQAAKIRFYFTFKLLR